MRRSLETFYRLIYKSTSISLTGNSSLTIYPSWRYWHVKMDNGMVLRETSYQKWNTFIILVEISLSKISLRTILCWGSLLVEKSPFRTRFITFKKIIGSGIISDKNNSFLEERQIIRLSVVALPNFTTFSRVHFRVWWRTIKGSETRTANLLTRFDLIKNHRGNLEFIAKTVTNHTCYKTVRSTTAGGQT